MRLVRNTLNLFIPDWPHSARAGPSRGLLAHVPAAREDAVAGRVAHAASALGGGRRATERARRRRVLPPLRAGLPPAGGYLYICCNVAISRYAVSNEPRSAGCLAPAILAHALKVNIAYTYMKDTNWVSTY